MVRTWGLLALVAIVAGTTILLGWFTLPIRVALIVIAIAGGVWSLRGRRWVAPSPLALASVGLLLLLTIAQTALLALAASTDPIRSPWSVVSSTFVALFGILIATTVAAIPLFSGRVSLVGVACAVVTTSLVAILVYPIGFGFDHFIHAATERIILADGGVTPPPFFYSAHYGFVGILATLGLPVTLADRLLVPLLAAGLLVPLLYGTLRTMTDTRGAAFGTLALLIVPFLPLATSTPQSLANVFAIATVLLLMRGATRIATFASIAAFLANPLTGIPVIATTVTTVLLSRSHRIAGYATIAAGIIGIPAALSIGRLLLPNLPIDVGWPSLRAFWFAWDALPTPFKPTNADRSHADALAVTRILLPLLWVVLAAIGARIRRDAARPAVVGALIAAVAAPVVFSTVGLRTQLLEEQVQFPLRLLALAGLLLTPLVGIALATITPHIRSRSQRFALACITAVLATTTLILAYPRDDAQARSGLWSVSADDVAAVHAVVADAGDTPFVVFGNQMLGAAAIRELGFRPAFRGDDGREFLAFPAPAGGPVGRWFWTIVEMKTTRATIDGAMRHLGVSRAYLVLHHYWRNATTLGDTLSAIADTEIGAFTHLRVFRFDGPR